MKRFFDILVALFLLFLFTPLFIVLWALVRKTGPNVIYSHNRVGKNGNLFPCYKFRSMVNNANEILEELLERDPKARAEWESTFKLKNDPRITGIGRFLRKTSLDELPQLWNVVKGDMSLVGPRPVVQEELDKYYGDKKKEYLKVRPGMTGLWQISGRSDTSYEERVELDTYYANNHNLWMDIKILFGTFIVVIFGKGAY